MKKYIYLIVFIITYFYLELASSDFTKDDLIPNADSITDKKDSVLENFLLFIKNSLFGILTVISIGVFLFLGAKLVIAKGNPEEFKKAMTGFIYGVVGIFFVIASWLLVKLVVGLDIN